MLTRRHFKKFAEIAAMIADKETCEKVTKELVALCKEENPRFNSERFLAYVQNLKGN